MTLWNQKGSQVVRGNLLVIPIADSLLYVESFYLQAEGNTGKLPELRQVAVATLAELQTGKSFDEALAKLFPGLGATKPSAAVQQPEKAAVPQETASQQPQQPAPGEVDRLLKQAAQLLADYERLTAEGKHREAGDKLDQLKQTLTELNRKRTGGA
jgi:uncharacterized membrane protein (UPF0182 family)